MEQKREKRKKGWKGHRNEGWCCDVWKEENNMIEEARGKRDLLNRGLRREGVVSPAAAAALCCSVVFLQLYFTAPVEQCLVLLPRVH
ncbi:hypothetical protein QQF64_024714 [Cirrhinus molitorella]|uniref:Uncharacterized protein n=1 Tax=Cirrhinus molitorella TaxID=172907 RepID=A0ABR3NML4_9TELE